MSGIKGLTVAAALAAGVLSAGQAAAIPIHVGSETSLQEILNDITVGGNSSIDVNTDQVEPHNLWSIGGAGGSFSQIVIEIAGYAGSNSFGIYDPYGLEVFEIYGGSASAGAQATVGITASGEIRFNNALTGTYFNGNVFGFYLNTPDTTWYSQDERNSDAYQHMVAFQGTGTDWIKPCLATSCSGDSSAAGRWLTSEYILAWEDLPSSSSDLDYNDFVVLVESVHPVPEPASIALLGMGLLGMSCFRRRNKGDRTTA